ncbi:MAG: RagB/SusD family nutrient uptake outer membrane protein, partial [Chitinophagaceae bacterium]|nr:RagB/SusD family nutrient uptake outer membrane protein [Chitinophagaceae bacterium]
MKRSVYNRLFSVFFILLICGAGCNKFVEVGPPAHLITSENTFNNDATAIAVMSGLYSEMMSSPTFYSSTYASLLPALSADEFYHYQVTQFEEFGLNELSLASHGTIEQGFWTPLYNHIYTCNLVIENTAKQNLLSPKVKDMLAGEARFVRAFAYFELVNLFGDVPLILETNFRKSAAAPRTSVALVYEQIVKDLQEAYRLLPEFAPGVEVVRPGKWTSIALLSRVHLYRQDYEKSNEYATDIIESDKFSLAGNLDDVFLHTSTEAIWQLKPVSPSFNTWEAFVVVPTTSATTPGFLLTDELLSRFEVGDYRFTHWTQSRDWNGDSLYYPYKYKVALAGSPLTEYYTVLRLAEQYLIRAEARAKLNDLTGAISDLNTIRNRAGLVNAIAVSQEDILNAIAEERRTELFGEWGHRW